MIFVLLPAKCITPPKPFYHQIGGWKVVNWNLTNKFHWFSFQRYLGYTVAHVEPFRLLRGREMVGRITGHQLYGKKDEGVGLIPPPHSCGLADAKGASRGAAIYIWTVGPPKSQTMNWMGILAIGFFLTLRLCFCNTAVFGEVFVTHINLLRKKTVQYWILLRTMCLKTPVR